MHAIKIAINFSFTTVGKDLLSQPAFYQCFCNSIPCPSCVILSSSQQVCVCRVEAVEVRVEHRAIAQCWLVSPVPLDVLGVLSCAHLFCLLFGKETRRRKLRQVEIVFI